MNIDVYIKAMGDAELEELARLIREEKRRRAQSPLKALGRRCGRCGAGGLDGANRLCDVCIRRSIERQKAREDARTKRGAA